MRVVFHIISTGGGGGVSRTTRYIAEREKDPTREGPGPVHFSAKIAMASPIAKLTAFSIPLKDNRRKTT